MHVVVLAYGPAQVTKRAAFRAMQIAGKTGRVIAVAASPTGVKAVAGLGNLETSGQIGRHGLREVFEQLPDEPTLLVHDDVVITPHGAAALQRALASGARYVVPHSNDQDVPQFVRSLPTGQSAERKLDSIPAPFASRPVAAAKPSCLLASSSDLVHLLEHPLADPLAVLRTPETDFTVAAGALAAHSTRCLHRTVSADRDGRPLLVAALIVKDEEEFLPGCLDSLQPLVDRIEICDTGSIDRTIEIAAAAGAHVIERPWPHDFGAARNFVLEQCRDARYILTVDADERVICSDPTATRSFLATYSAEHPALSIEVENVDESGVTTSQFSSVRLFHAKGTEYRGAIHEVVYPIGDDTPLAGAGTAQLRIVHHGYTDQVVANRDKARRNLELAETEYELNPGPRSALHLARSLDESVASRQRALQLLEKTLTESPNAEPKAKAQILGLMADQWMALDEHERAFDASRRALEHVPADDTAAAYFATAAERLDRLDEFVAFAEGNQDRSSPRPAQYVESNRAIYQSTLVAAYARGGQPEKAVAEAFAVLDRSPHNFGAWAPLVDCLRVAYGSAAVELLAPLAAKDPHGLFLEPIIRSFPTAALASFAADYCAAGGTLSEVTRVGLLAAAMAGDDAAFRRLAPAAVELEEDVRSGLADRIAGLGRSDLAVQLRTDLVGAGPTAAR